MQMYDRLLNGITASKGKVFEKSEDTSHRFGNKDMTGDKGCVVKTKDNLAPEPMLDSITLYMMK